MGTVGEKNQDNALVKIITGFAMSTIACFLIGNGIACGTGLFQDAESLPARNGYEPVKSFPLTFAAAVSAIISGGIAERVGFYP